MNYIEEIIAKSFKDEKILEAKEINLESFYDKNNKQKSNYYYKFISDKQVYFLKIKRNLQNEINIYNVVKNTIPVPHIYYYGRIADNSMDYIIEEFVDGINIYNINLNKPQYKQLAYSAGEVFGKVFNTKRKINNFHDDINLSALNIHEKELLMKYYNNYYIYDGLILFDVAYLCSIEKIEIIKIADFENCLYGDIRPYISIYKQTFGKEFILGFDAYSKTKYSQLEIIDKDEYFSAQIIKEKLL